MRGGAPFVLGTGIESRSIPPRSTQTSRALAPPFKRRPAAPHLPARRPPRPGGLRVGGLARRGGAAVGADAAARAARPPPLALQGGLGVRRLARLARGADSARQQGRGARLPRARGGLDRGLGALRPARRGCRPSPLRARMGGAAPLRRRARLA